MGDILTFDIEGSKIILRKEELELPVLKGGKGLTVEKIEESIRKGMKED